MACDKMQQVCQNSTLDNYLRKKIGIISKSEVVGLRECSLFKMQFWNSSIPSFFSKDLRQKKKEKKKVLLIRFNSETK